MKWPRFIKLTKEDIENGVRGHPLKCPLSLSLKRKFPNLDSAVSWDRVRLGINFKESEPTDDCKRHIDTIKYMYGFTTVFWDVDNLDDIIYDSGLSKRLSNFVKDFDCGKYVSPGIFVIWI